MADVGFLSTLVKSLVREEEERREAVGLLLDLSEVSAVRRRIGRIQGCIVMLVALRNGDDPVASRDAAKLLNVLSCNAQNALHMAEAGYFKPIVKYLKEGDKKVVLRFVAAFCSVLVCMRTMYDFYASLALSMSFEFLTT